MDPPPSHRAARLGGREKTERPAAGLARRYLNTPEAGGGTRFNDLGITVEPRRGSAVLWPSLLDSDVELPELQTHHEVVEALTLSLTLTLTLTRRARRRSSRRSGG